MSLQERLFVAHPDLTPAQCTDLLRYLDLMRKWNRTYNLTAISDPAQMFTHHLLDSLTLLPHVGVGPLLDVGSGAGLPGIPLAVARPDLAVTTLDASQKKCGFMQQAAIDLKLLNLRVVHGRVEDFQPENGYAVIVSRAFSDLGDFVRLTRHLLAPGGRWLAMKGAYPRAEVEQLKEVRVVENIELHAPGLDAERCLVIMERT
ncbi:MAG: 16S rRNA (guanine(527)-N(7))-methyltransferase RsmG [Betaproteobacteria bacterium]|nr:16S rRNA (guanine(527)-N(7))-methyltransferase RsmG [Betaproteobacteria bacterium]